MAHIRAEESSLASDARLFEDPYARIFRAEGAAREGVDRFLDLAFVREQVRLRTRFFDDFVRIGLRDGVQQVVLLGAGFDCRALRMQEFADGIVPVFEIDFDAQLERKRERLAAAGVAIPPFVRYVGFDFDATALDPSLNAALVRQGFRPQLATLSIWEGVTPYLDDEAVDRSLSFMARAGGTGTRVALDYHVARFDSAALAARLLAAGFTTVDDVGLDDLHRRHFANEAPDLAGSFRIAVARV